MRAYTDNEAGAPRIIWRSWRTLLIVAALAGLVAACKPLPPDCRVDDLDDRQMSTRVLFLERLNGCPIGGRN